MFTIDGPPGRAYNNAVASPPPSARSARRWRLAGALAALLLPLAAYVATLAPSLSLEDAAEFALGGAALGVDHPSGYPLQTLAAHLFTYLPAGELAWRMNLASAAFGALAALFLFLLTWEVLAPLAARPAGRAAAAWLAAALFALGRSFWPQAVITEVYALNAAAVACALWLAVRGAASRDGRWLLAAVLAAALGAANHPSSLVVTAPVAAWALWSARREARGAHFYGAAAAVFLLGISVYLYLALRSSRWPALNWGTPASAAAFWDHVRRREFGTIYWPRYRYLGFHALELGKLLLWQFGPGAGVLALPGVVWLWRRRAPAARPLALAALLAGPAMLLPLVGLLTPIQVFEIEVWYIPFFLLAACFVGAAAAAVLTAIPGSGARAAAAVAFALLPLAPWLANQGVADRRGYCFARAHGENLLRTYPYDALVAFPLDEQLGLFEHGFQRFVLGRRPDVTLVDPRNTIRNDLLAARRAPRYVADPDGAAAWWFGFRRDLVAGSGRPFFYNVDDDRGAAWGVATEPFGLMYYGRRVGDAAPPWTPPWGRYDYRGVVAVAAVDDARAASYEPAAYRLAAHYYAAAAAYCLARDRGKPALADLARAGGLARREWTVAWLVAGEYTRWGYPDRALPYYRVALGAADRYRHDALLFRLQYASLLAGMGAAYWNAGDATNGRRCFGESLALNPNQPALVAAVRGGKAGPSGAAGRP